MGPLVAVALWAAVGLGVLLVVQGFRGRQVLPSLRREAPGGVGRDAVLIWAMVALVTGVAVLAVTGWPVAAAAAVVLVVMIPRLMSGQRTHQEYIQRTQAIATWTEMIRDNMAGAAGLGQALQATTVFAPAPIAPEIRRFSARLDHSSLVDALHALGEDLNHPSADLIVVALSNAARLETRELAVARKDGQSSPLLSRLATAIRDDVRMRLRVDVGRARIRTSARIVVATTVLTIVFLYLFAGDLLEPYDTLAGQAWMCVVTAVFVLGGWMLSVYGRVQMPERFSTRRRSQRAVGEGRP
jgi:Flp pilus assembly protein TadB